MLCAVVTGATREHRAQCSVEAKVSIERIGPHGTFAGHRPDLSDYESAATLTIPGTRWAAGSIFFRGGAGADSRRLTPGLKSVGLGGSRRCETHKRSTQHRAQE